MSEQDPFAEPGTAEQGPEPEPEQDTGKAFNYLNLRSSEPDINPRKAGADLDLDAGPYAHLVTGLVKQSGSTGSEAWMHYIIAMILILDGETLFEGDNEPETDERTAVDFDNEG